MDLEEQMNMIGLPLMALKLDELYRSSDFLTMDRLEMVSSLLKPEYEDKTTGIEIQGSINLFFHIDNMKTFISKQTIILSDCKENELRIENHYIDNVIIEKNKIILQFERRL